MKKLMLMLAVAMANTAIAASDRPVYHNPVGDEFPIVGWYSMPDSALTPERFHEMRRAGFNLSLSHLRTNDEVERSLNAAENSGVKLLIMTDEISSKPRATVERFRNHPSLAGYYLMDEPTAHSFGKLALLRDSVYASDSNACHMAYLNLLPDLIEPKGLGTQSYEEYLQRFIDEIRVPMVSYDLYPIIEDCEDGKCEISVRENLYTNLERVSSVCRSNGLPFWAFCLATAHAVYPVPRMSHLRLEAFAALAYGAQGLQYFTYWEPVTKEGFYHSAIDYTGKRTDVYYMIADLNREIKALTPVFMGNDVISVTHTGQNIPAMTTRFERLPSPFIGPLVSDGMGVIVSHFMGGDGHEYLMLVNRDIVHAQSVDVDFSGEISIINPDGSQRPASRMEDILPGGYLLYRLK